ncbi:MAG: hypothetical protein OEZ04_08280 [Nitrospinota bacterium]|nr:hypothetical protein [Nitrospinota bacterium]
MKYGLFLKVIVLSFVFMTPHAALSSGANSKKTTSKGVGEESGKKKYDKNTLTPEQLEKCIILESDIEKANTALKKDRELLQAEEKDVLQYKKIILAEKDTMDLSDREMVASFNKNVKEYNTRRGEYNANADKYRTQSDIQRKMNQDYNGQCASKGYYEEDRQAAEKKLAK